MAIGLQIQRETQKTGMCTQKINSDARPDVNPGVFTDTIRIQRPEASVYRSRGLYFQRTPMQTRRQQKQKQKQKQTVVNGDREHRDGCTNWVKPRIGGQLWGLTMIGSWQQWAKQGHCKSKEQSKNNKQNKALRRLTDRTTWRTTLRAQSTVQWRARMTEIEQTLFSGLDCVCT